MDFSRIIQVAIFVFLAYLVWRYKNRKSIYLKKNGVGVPATVLDVIRQNYWKKTSFDVDKTWCYEILLSATAPGSAPLELKIKQYFKDECVPNTGEKVTILTDPRLPWHPQNMMIEDITFRANDKFTIFGIDIPYRRSSYKIKN